VLPVLLLRQGRSLPEVGLASLLALPWALKFLVAPFVDRVHAPRFGRRRAVLLPVQAASVAVLLALSTLELDGGLRWLLAGVLLVNALSALQDVAADGLAVEILDLRDRGLGNGLQVAAYRVGMILGGGVLLVLAPRLEWSGTFAAMAALLLLSTLPALLHREAEQPHVHDRVHWLGELAGWLRRPGAPGWLGVLLLYKFGEHTAQSMARPMLIQRGYGEADIGWIFGGVGFTTGLLGALLGGALVLRFPPRKGLVIFGSTQAVAVLGYALAARFPAPPIATAAVGLELFTSGMATASLFTHMMSACRPGRAATDYTLQASAVVIATAAAGSISGFSAQALGYTWHFVAASAVALVAVAYVSLHSFRAVAPPGAPPPQNLP
jgi:MFS transporter, PAT family, beta-lactamase induction signal transducer AmpG